MTFTPETTMMNWFDCWIERWARRADARWRRVGDYDLWRYY